MASYSSHFSIQRLWWILGVGMAVMFGTLLYYGGRIHQAEPPIPAAVRSETGATVFTREQIERGQNVWQSLGGMEQGSIWGHGSYVAPDWSADWLHREALALLDRLAWNLVGAGVFGFLINPPLALYYRQGLNTTPTHGHAAQFGVYGMLGLGLTLFCMRGLLVWARVPGDVVFTVGVLAFVARAFLSSPRHARP